MIEVKEKSKCCGCTACQNACPKMCIKMASDEEGFCYPVVDKSICIDCGICEKVCPVISGFDKNYVMESFVVRNKENSILDNSTSGGAFSAIATYALAQKGVVYGCICDEKMNIVHTSTDEGVDLSAFRGSKYVQSEIQGVFRRIRKNLKEGRFVIFSGTPCQVAGLNNYLGRNYEKLLTVEVICHGTPSPYLWKLYVAWMMDKHKSEPVHFNFRKKTYGYHSSTMEVLFKNGVQYTGSARVDLMLKSFFSEISSRPSCYICPCKGLERAADISIYDCWSAEKLVAGLKDDDRGYTNVMISSEKGKQVIEYCEKQDLLYVQSVNTENAIKFDGVMVCKYPHKHLKREVFYKTVCKEGIEKAVQQYIPITHKDHLIEDSKQYMYKLGFIRMVRKIKGWKNNK